MQHEVTREVFLDFTLGAKIAFYVLVALATATFLWGAWLKIRKYRRGRPDARFGHLVRRIASGLGRSFSNTTVGKRNAGIGVTHALIMWGFTALFIGTAILTVNEDIVGVLRPQWQ
ncbi:MAG: Fe-S oxidoreductase, partial [Gemmatimonadota bacterium]